MHDLTLEAPTRKGQGAYFDTLKSFRDQAPLSALIPHLESVASLLPAFGTLHILYRAPLCPDNRTPILSISFSSSTENHVAFYLVTLAAFNSPQAAWQALQSASRSPVKFWLQVRKPTLYREISECPLLKLPELMVPLPFPLPS